MISNSILISCIGTVLCVASLGCASRPFGEFVPVSAGDVPAHLDNAQVVRKRIRVGRGANLLNIPEGSDLKLLRVSLEASELPLNLALVLTLTCLDKTQSFVLDDEPEADGRMGIRQSSLSWPNEETILPGGAEVWIAVTAYSWSALDFLDHPARRRIVSQTYKPDLPGVPHDREVQVPRPMTYVEFFVVPKA